MNPEDIRNADVIRCYGGYHDRSHFHVWMNDGRLLRLYPREEEGYHVLLQGKEVKDLKEGESELLYRVAHEAYGSRRGL